MESKLQEAIEYLDEKFAKGDKRRGEAMCLLGIANVEKEQEILKLIKDKWYFIKGHRKLSGGYSPQEVLEILEE